MSKGQHHSERLSMELMKKFREGTLSEKEKTYLDQLQAQDPFIAEALEGMAEVTDGNAFTEDVDELRGRIRQRAQTSKSLRVYWLPVAASLVVLVGVFYIFYTQVQPSDAPVLLSKEAAPSSSESEMDEPGALSPILALPPENMTDAPALDEQTSPQTLAMVQLPAEERSLPSSASPEAESMKESAAGRAIQAEEIPEIVSEVEAESMDDSFSLTKKSELSEIKKKVSAVSINKTPSEKYPASALQGAKSGGKVVNGRVVDQENKDPIPGANVLVKGTSLGAVTDVDGRFSLTVPPNSNAVQVNTIGYETLEIEINQQDSVYIAMNPDVQMLSEVVVVGYGVQERRALSGSVSSITEEDAQADAVISAQPMEGMRAFKKYLGDNQRFPEGWQEGDKAVVKLSFFVQPNGKLTDFSIEKSAGAWLDQEAIRLIQEGPAWKAATQNDQAIGQEVKFRVRFKK